MIFHLGFELPKPPQPATLDESRTDLTEEEFKIVKTQIRKNTELIDSYIAKLDLFVNKEQYPYKEAFIQKIRDRLYVLMEENDTFRKVLWRQMQQDALVYP